MNLDEFSLIRLLTERNPHDAAFRRDGVITGIGDDAAVIEPVAGMQLVLTCDTMTEEIHFKTVTMSDYDIGYKAMASATSDIAAMGGMPRYALIALSIPKQTPIEGIRALYDGLRACADRYGIEIVGGDTTSSAGGRTVSVTVIGEVEAGNALLRSAAQPGDAVFVTGYPGMSAAGLAMLLERNAPSGEWHFASEWEAALVQAHCRPEPQIAAGRQLLAAGCRALNDVSDGVASEAWEIAEASRIGIDLLEGALPVHEAVASQAAVQGKNPLDYVLYGGEDYQLIGTLPQSIAAEVQSKLQDAGIALHLIGTVTLQHREVRLIGSDGSRQTLEKGGYNHFR